MAGQPTPGYANYVVGTTITDVSGTTAVVKNWNLVGAVISDVVQPTNTQPGSLTLTFPQSSLSGTVAGTGGTSVNTVGSTITVSSSVTHVIAGANIIVDSDGDSTFTISSTASGSNFVAHHDLTGSSTNQVVVGINTIPISGSALSNMDGYALVTVSGSYVQQGNRGVINVRNFGAKGDNVTDDTAAIQAAMDYAAQLTVPNSRPTNFSPATVFFPPGIYLTSKPIFVYSTYSNGIEVFGEGGSDGNDYESGPGSVINCSALNAGVMPAMVLANDPYNDIYPVTDALEQFGNIWMWDCGYYDEYDYTQIVLSYADCADINGLSSLTYECFVNPHSGSSPGDFWTLWSSCGSTGDGTLKQAVNLQVATADDGNNYVNASLTTVSGVVQLNSSGSTVPAEQVTHVALVYNGGEVQLFVGGVLAASASCSGSVVQSPFETVTIGTISETWPAIAAPIVSPCRFGGIRLTNSVVYSGSFTPPTTEPTLNPINTPDTLILINFDPQYTLTSQGARDGWVVGQSSVCTIKGDITPSRPSSGVPVWFRTYGTVNFYLKGAEVHHLTFYSNGDGIYTDALLFGNIRHCNFQGTCNRGITFNNYSYCCNLENCVVSVYSSTYTPTGVVGNFFTWGVGQLYGAQHNTIKNHHHNQGANWGIVAVFGTDIGIYNSYMITAAMGSIYAAETGVAANGLQVFDEGTTPCTVACAYFVNNTLVNCTNCVFQSDNAGQPCITFGNNDIVSISNTTFSLPDAESVGYLRFLVPLATPAEVSGYDYLFGFWSATTSPALDPAYSFGPLIIPTQERFGNHVINIAGVTNGVYTMNQNDFFWGTITITDTNSVLTGKTNVLLPTNVAGYKRTFINDTDQLLVIGGNLGVQTVAHPAGGCVQMVSNGTGWTLLDTGNTEPALSAYGNGNWIGAAGGDIVTIFGVAMEPGDSLAFWANGIPMPSASWISDTMCTAIAPAQSDVASPTSNFVLSGTNGNGQAFINGTIEYNWDPSQLDDLVSWYRVGQPNDGYTFVSASNVTKLLPLAYSDGYNEPLYNVSVNPAPYVQNAIGGRPAFWSQELTRTNMGTRQGLSEAVVTVSGSTVTVTGLSNMTPDVVGSNITLYGGGSNQGVWPIASYIDAESVTITNADAVTDATEVDWLLDFSTSVTQPFTISTVVSWLETENVILPFPTYYFHWFNSYTYAAYDLASYIANTGGPTQSTVFAVPAAGGLSDQDILGTVQIPNSNWQRSAPGLPLSLDTIFNDLNSQCYFNNTLSASGSLGSSNSIDNIAWGTDSWMGYMSSLVITSGSISDPDRAALSLWRTIYYGVS